MAKVNIGAELSALPLGEMLSGPLTAAIEAQAMSAVSTAEFVNLVGFEEDSGGTGGARKVVMIPFEFESTVVNPETGEATEKTTELTVPLLSMVEAPHISIEDLSVSFEFKIRDVMSKSNQFKLATSSTTSASLNIKNTVGANIGLPQFKLGASASTETTANFKTNFNVSATYQRSARHETDRSATLKMTMNARQRVPEGFQRVLSILNDAITAQVETA
ncbi:DUF2589 domain-containing protein [Nisaea sp.]|uniref:DUF2589 domain-containing protein n=1 Tax=Nisaea sp. TaxID=2024842 RepID=UPI003B52FEBD